MRSYDSCEGLELLAKDQADLLQPFQGCHKDPFKALAGPMVPIKKSKGSELQIISLVRGLLELSGGTVDHRQHAFDQEYTISDNLDLYGTLVGVTNKNQFGDFDPKEMYNALLKSKVFVKDADVGTLDTVGWNFQNPQEPEQLILTLAALLCYERLLPYTLDDTTQPINSCYLADFDVLLTGESLSNRRTVFERIGFSFLRILATLGDKYEDIIQLLAVALDKDAPSLESFDGLIDQYGAPRIKNGVSHLRSYNEVMNLQHFGRLLDGRAP
ncbi:MAG: hypothetical protein Q9214_001826 [Letrouitia sp. 1 TL-2023]